MLDFVEVEGGVKGEWKDNFPFIGDFRQVVHRQVSLTYVESVVQVLEPVVELFTAAVERGELTKTTIATLVYSVVALARCKVVLAYASEIVDDGQDRDSLFVAVLREWKSMEERECFPIAPYTDCVGHILEPSILAVWKPFVVRQMVTARELQQLFPRFVLDLEVVLVAQVLVVRDGGVPLCKMLSGHGDKLVLTYDVFLRLWQRLEGIDVETVSLVDSGVVLAERSEPLDTEYGALGSMQVMHWLWALLVPLVSLRGYCYQLLCHPALRFDICSLLGRRPLVADVLQYLERYASDWALELAVVQVKGDLHVDVAGNPDVGWLSLHATSRIGMQSDEVPTSPDYYARALVDEFIGKYKPVPMSASVPPPLDAEFDTLTVSTESGAGREFIDVAKVLYSAVDEAISPRAEVGDTVGSACLLDNDSVDERDSEVVKSIYYRLIDGAVISEDYFRHTYKRFQKFRRRPKLSQSGGRMYHVFEGFPADGGVGLGPWEIDKLWGIPGWVSYVADFPAGGAMTVAFAVAGGCQDVRMDCTGEGAIELGDCKVRVDGTLLWFTNSIRFHIVAKGDVTLRISVPDAKVASAMGVEMRKYMHIPGYALVARSFDVITGSIDINIIMDRVKRSSIAGCQVYSGQRYLERGRHRIRLGQVASLAPARVLFRTDPPEAMANVSVCGMRAYPRSRDHVSVLIDLRNVEMYVTMNIGATLMISLLQIVRVKEYELTVVSVADAKAVKRS